MQFLQTCWRNLAGGPKFFPVKVRKGFENLKKKFEIFFRRSVAMDAKNTNLTNPSKNIWQNAKIFCSVSKKIRKAYDFWQKFSFKLFLWTSKMQLWQPRCKFFDKSRNFSAQCQQFIKKSDSFFVENICFLKVLLKTDRKPFRQLHQKSINTKIEIFRSMSQVDHFFSKKIVVVKIFIHYWECNFHKPSKQMAKRPKDFTLNVQNWKFFFEVFLWTRRMQFPIHSIEIFVKKGHFFSLNVLKYLNISFFSKKNFFPQSVEQDS